MELTIGSKIRELRRRDGRTQEAMAEALGVTGQAVSRWESGGSYPDMEMLPAIANYFHVSIDELFGYDNNREERIRAIVAAAERATVENGRTLSKGWLSDDFLDCIDALRAGAEEFPNEPRILLELARALHHWGYSQYGARVTRNEETGAYEDDVAYHAQNEYWREAIDIFEKMLNCDLHRQQRSMAVFELTALYRCMGEYEKARALAESQSEIRNSREMMLYFSTTGAERDRYRAEGILELLERMGHLSWDFVCRNPDVTFSEYGYPLMLAILQTYDRIFTDGRCGSFHYQIGTWYKAIANLLAHRGGEKQEILELFDKAFDHLMTYKQLRNETEYAYTAPLVASMEPISGNNVIALSEDMWAQEFRNYPESILSEIRGNPKYRECFDRDIEGTEPADM